MIQALWTRLRNRLLADPRFHRFALRTPGLNAIARARASRLFDVVAGFVYAQTLAALVELDLLARLARDPARTAALAQEAAMSEPAMERLLKAAAALDLVERLGQDLWTLGPQGAPALADPGVPAMVRHHRALYEDLVDPIAALRRGPGGGALQRFWTYAGADPQAPQDADAAAPYSALMSASQPAVAEQALDALDLSDRRRLLDVGGGEGAFAMAAVRRYPALSATVFDLPSVVERTSRRILEAGLAHRIDVHAGRFPNDQLPPGRDVIAFVRVLHDHDDAIVARLFARAHEALSPGGVAFIAEPMAGTAGARAMGDAYFGLYLWAMGSGRPRTPREYRAKLMAAGFKRVRERPTALPLRARVVVAER